MGTNPHVINIYQVGKREARDMCATTYQLHVYMEKVEDDLAQLLSRRLRERKNFTEEELINFISKVVDSLLYIQDNGLKNILLDAEAIIISNDDIKVLDLTIAESKRYFNLLEAKEKELSS